MQKNWPILLCIALIAGCLTQDKPQEKAQAIWKTHEQVLLAVSRDEPIDLNEFEEACDFFSRVAGIQVPGNGSSALGWYPTAKTANALGPIQRWYNENKTRLYWDAERQEVVTLPRTPE
jgi:hypothetical protein